MTRQLPARKSNSSFLKAACFMPFEDKKKTSTSTVFFRLEVKIKNCGYTIYEAKAYGENKNKREGNANEPNEPNEPNIVVLAQKMKTTDFLTEHPFTDCSALYRVPLELVKNRKLHNEMLFF